MKASGPKKELFSVKEHEEEILKRVQPKFQGKLWEIVDEYHDVLKRNRQRVDLPRGRLSTLSR